MDPKQNRPVPRKKNVATGGTGARRRGDGLGTGPVGSENAHSSGSAPEIRPTGGQDSGRRRGITRAAAGGGGIGLILMLVGLFILPKLFGGGMGGGNNAGVNDLVENLLTGAGDMQSGYSQQEQQEDSDVSGEFLDTPTEVDNTVVSSARAKRTQILGNGKDKVTMMIYMCGTDLESKYGMASSDMGEIARATYGDNVRILVYTGGCSNWKTQGISSKTNQMYEIIGGDGANPGHLKQLISDDGNKAMTDPNTLSAFIKECSRRAPANRYELILWDHGGGSVSGYGYDEKKGNGSMSLAGISKALKDGGVKFDFIGFDACLMATAENALMLDQYADYLIASEETEPGVGWYYTKWVTALGRDTSIPTTKLGKQIVDDFVATCAEKCRGQKTTLSVIDLAEFSATVPSKLKAFSNSVSSLISSNQYQTVAEARNGAREFAQKSKIDQIDLVDFAENTATQEGAELAAAIKSAVKYNLTSSNISDAHGVSIYFPYKRTSYVDPACSTYSQIGMDDSYSKCIRQFAKLETSGQIAAGGSSSPLGALFGSGYSGASGSADSIGSLLSAFLGGGRSVTIDGLDRSNTSFMQESGISDEAASEFIAENHIDPSLLKWKQSGNDYKLILPEDQMELVTSFDLNMFYDDGEGYIDLGLDSVFSYDEEGNFVADTSRNWPAINGQTIAFYLTDIVKNNGSYSITGYSPAYLNNERVNLIIVFDDEHDAGYIAGAVPDYVNGETDTIAKSMTEINNGDKIDFICDYYTYDGEYQDSYYLGDTLTYSSDMKVLNNDVGKGAIKITYRITDIYDQAYWTDPIIK